MPSRQVTIGMMRNRSFRAIDTGSLSSIDTADAAAKADRLRPSIGGPAPSAGMEVPDTLRFLRFPPTALIGRHQAMQPRGEGGLLQLENDIGTRPAHHRRRTRSIFDENQVGWELVLSRRASLANV